ncbi:MAG: hypothetical protein KBT27_15260 [Prevotellaceae bacterium]|nr:hypothetical protein [Candidatus Faecinaster equi]
MANRKYLDNDGLLYFWTKLKSYFVKQEAGKGLSTNDLTNDLKGHYDAAYTHSTAAHAPANAEHNTIVGVQRNGVDVSVDSATRKVNITVPTKTSEITNDSGFITTSDIPEGAAASTTSPKMDGTATVGTELAFARGDHIHPSDTSKVDKVSGKGLSTNDLTTALKNNYDAAYTHSQANHAPSDAEKNIIVGIQTNGSDVTVNSSTRKVNIAIPTKTSDIDNDSGFITIDDVPEGASASTTAPKMDGVATVGSETAFARGDHVHPSDTNKVDKVAGKELSSNDYTDADKNKLADIDAGAEVNVIESIKVNGTAQTVTSKAVDITIPTNNNQLTNGAGYQTSAQVESAITGKGYQTSAQVEAAITAKGYATTTEVATAVANADHLKRQKVTGSTLPDVATADVNTIYMLPITSATGDNKFTEWMVIDGAWEKTGDSDVDLSGYVQDSDLTAITNGEIDTVVAS